MADDIENKRTSERHSLEFEVEVFAVSGTEKETIEKTTLHDISGGGACFLSSHPESYSIGQRITLEICMPDTHKTDACMQGQATIARIDDIQATEADKTHQASIGVSMDNMLSFQQKSKDTNSSEEGTWSAS